MPNQPNQPNQPKTQIEKAIEALRPLHEHTVSALRQVRSNQTRDFLIHAWEAAVDAERHHRRLTAERMAEALREADLTI